MKVLKGCQRRRRSLGEGRLFRVLLCFVLEKENAGMGGGGEGQMSEGERI